MTKYKIPAALKTEISNDNIVLFVGSGTSIQLGMPSWNNLVKNIIDHIVSKTDNKELSMFKDLLIPGGMDALDVLTQIEKKDFRKLTFDYLGDNLRLSDNPNLDLHKKLFNLCPRIITTNYDHAFEQILGDNVHVISNSSKHGLANLSKKNEYIFKIHGDINTPENCILFQSDYENLYNNKSDNQDLFTTQLKNYILNKTLVFIGFSLNDPFVKEIMDHVNQITHGMMNQHYLFTTDKDFKIPYIHPIILEDYADLEPIIDELKKEFTVSKKLVEDNSNKNEPKKEISKSSEKELPFIHILNSDPIDKDYDFNIEYIQRSFSKHKLNLRIACLNLNEIRNCDNGYLILFSKVVKGNLIIEDEYLKSRQISVNDLVDDFSDEISGVIIFTNELPKLKNVEEIKTPCLFIIEENQTKIKRKIDTILYKLFRGNTDFIHKDDVKIGVNPFEKIEIEKGKPNIIINKPQVSRYIDKKLLTHFVGRKTDVENISRKIIDLEYEDKLLTIKGSGGIGKTTIIVKTILELAKRNVFTQIEYITCQSISSYDNFNFQISNCLNIDSSTNLSEYIDDGNRNKQIVIILDNFETLLQLNEKTKILNLVSKLCDNFIIVTTSRQILDLEFEELYELRNLTTDEGLLVFKNYYDVTLSEEDEKILRYDIIEELLNNNPLAIKIISKGTPKSKNIFDLKKELQENIFNNENINKIFEKPEDINIEKSNSLFYSIKYSYDKLDYNEKLAFELLSLFPDGIHFENLKAFAKQNKDSAIKVTDKEIRSLENKSLLENSSGFLKLQSIVNRFSSYQFNLRTEEVKKNYYTLCFQYNYFFIKFLNGYLKTSESLPIQDDSINNYLKCIEYIKLVDKPNEDKLDYIDYVSVFFRNINQHKNFLELVNDEKIVEQFNKKEKDFLKLICYTLIYWCENFEIISSIRKIYSEDDINKLDLKNKIDKLIYGKYFTVITCEGDNLVYLKDRIERWYISASIIDDLFRLGLINLASTLVKYEKDITFIEFDILYENGKLKIKELDTYISKLYKKESLELIQTSFIRIKHDPELTIDTTNFTVTNPYTKGMIALINAIGEKDFEKKHKFFKKAIKNLNHIKFYYVEAIYNYCKFLIDIDESDLFQVNFDLGKKISKKFNFWYLDFKFDKLLDQSITYDEDSIFDKIDNFERKTFDLFITQHIEENKKAVNKK